MSDSHEDFATRLKLLADQGIQQSAEQQRLARASQKAKDDEVARIFREIIGPGVRDVTKVLEASGYHTNGGGSRYKGQLWWDVSDRNTFKTILDIDFIVNFEDDNNPRVYGINNVWKRDHAGRENERTTYFIWFGDNQEVHPSSLTREMVSQAVAKEFERGLKRDR